MKKPYRWRLDESRYVVDNRWMDYNHCRTHSSPDYISLTAFAMMRFEQSCSTFRLAEDREIKYEILLQQPAQKLRAGQDCLRHLKKKKAHNCNRNEKGL